MLLSVKVILRKVIPVKVIKVSVDGSLHVIDIRPSFDKIREIVGGAVDTVRLFSDVVTYIKRFPEETDKFNKKLQAIKGDVLITGGRGSYLMGLTDEQIQNIKQIFNDSGGAADGKSRV